MCSESANDNGMPVPTTTSRDIQRVFSAGLIGQGRAGQNLAVVTEEVAPPVL